MTIHDSQPGPTPPPSDVPDALEQLLTEHLTVALEPQRGRAAVAFRAQLAEQRAEAPAAIPITRGAVPRRALWYWAGVPSLVAAGLAVVVTLQMVNPPAVMPPQQVEGSQASGGTVAPASAGTLVFDQYETSQALNGGIAEMDGAPVRIIRQQGTRETRWVDPKEKAVYSLTEEPIEKVGYLRIQPN